MINSQSGDESLAVVINWPETNLGLTADLECPCGRLNLRSTQLRATRYCGGDFDTGGQWENPSVVACNTSDITRQICRLSNVSELQSALILSGVAGNQLISCTGSPLGNK